MFRLLSTAYTLLILALFAGLALVFAVVAEDGEARARDLLLLGGATILALLGGLALSLWMARRLRQALHAVIGAADKVGEGIDGQRVFPDGPRRDRRTGRRL